MLSDNKYTIKPALTEKFSGIIWKIEIDAQLPLLAIETRNGNERSSAISVLNFETGECLIKELQVEDSWNWSLDRLHNGITYLHSYADKETPLHKGIIALNLQGEISWQAYNKALYDISGDGIIAYDPRMQPRWLELLNAETGQVLKSVIHHYAPLNRDIQVPGFSSEAQALPFSLPEEVSGEIAWYVHNNKTIVSYHIRQQNTFTQQLLVTVADEILLKENLATGILKLNPEAFFITRNHLFYIRNDKREIVSYLV